MTSDNQNFKLHKWLLLHQMLTSLVKITSLSISGRDTDFYTLVILREQGNIHKMAGVSQFMLQLMERLLSSPKESRTLEDVERILPFFRTRTPVFHDLSKGERS